MIGDPAFFLDDRIGVERLDQGVAGRIMPDERAVDREMLFVEAVLLERRAARPAARHLAARHVAPVAVGDEAGEHRTAFSRKRVVLGKSESERGDLGRGRISYKKKEL